MASPNAKNLEAISKAIDQHNRNCPYPAAEVRMNPFEAERLGWEEIRGLPVVPDAAIGTGRFRIVCSRELEDTGLEETEAIGREMETVGPAVGRPDKPRELHLQVAQSKNARVRLADAVRAETPVDAAEIKAADKAKRVGLLPEA